MLPQIELHITFEDSSLLGCRVVSRKQIPTFRILLAFLGCLRSLYWSLVTDFCDDLSVTISRVKQSKKVRFELFDLGNSLALKMKTQWSFEMWATAYQSAQRLVQQKSESLSTPL